MSERAQKFLGLFILIAWLSSLYLLLPLPAQRIASFVQLDGKESSAFIEREMKDSGLPRSTVERALKLKHQRDREIVWVQWLFVAMLVMAGTVAGVVAFRRARDWPYYASSTSLLYLIGWLLYLSGSRTEVQASILDTYIFNLLNSFLVDSSISLIAFLHRDLLLPLFHFFVVTYLFYKRSELSAPKPAQR